MTDIESVASDSLPGISVSVMAYNEAPSLERVVTEIREELERMGNPFEVIIIYDGSSDGTAEIADRLSSEYPSVRVLHHKTNYGLGSVYRDGFYEAKMDLITLFPADGQFEPSIIPQFVQLFNAGDVDLVLGTIPEYQKSRSAFARFLSWGERVIYKGMFGGFPEFQGIMMFRRPCVESVSLTSTGRGWTIQMELILRFRNKGYHIVNEPTTIRPRMSGESKVSNLKSIISNLCQVASLRFQLWKK